MSPSTDVRENREFASEFKFMVARSLAPEIREWARGCLQPDPNASGETQDTYRITSLYFDTPTFDVFHRRGSFGRSKYRIRQYGQSEVAFLERKLKTRGLVSKRRSAVLINDLPALTAPQIQRLWQGYWFHRRLLARKLSPVCQIRYDRMARVAMTQYGPIRMTIDDNLRAVPISGITFTPEQGELLLADHVILELKFRLEMPLLFKQLVEQFALNFSTISKYRLGVAGVGMVSESPANPVAGKLGNVYA